MRRSIILTQIINMIVIGLLCGAQSEESAVRVRSDSRIIEGVCVRCGAVSVRGRGGYCWYNEVIVRRVLSL
jgi:hypothetical protein